MEDLISVGIMTYNQEKYIEDTLKSVIHQDYTNLELIILDDHSNDNTIDIIRKMEDKLKERFVRVLIIENERNTGAISKNNNILLNEYRGKYFKILGGDDMLTPDSCRKSMEAAKRDGYTSDVIFSDVYIIDEMFAYSNTVAETPKCEIMRNSDIAENNQVSRILKSNPFICIGALCKTSSVHEVGGYDENVIIEDYQMWIRMALHGKKFNVLHEILAYYRRTPTSVSNIKRDNSQYTEKEIKYTTQIFKTLNLFRNECNVFDFYIGILNNVIGVMVNQSVSGHIDGRMINQILVNCDINLDSFDIIKSLLKKMRTCRVCHNNFLVYGYGAYGRFAVYLLDESGIKYEQIVDNRADQMVNLDKEICNLQEINPDVDWALVTPKNLFSEINKMLNDRGIHNTMSFSDFLDEFIEEYVLEKCIS